MEGRERAKTVFKKIKNDYTFRTFALSSLSLLITAAYTVYNVFLAIFYKSAWNMGIAVYYVIPISIKAFVITEELKFLKTKASEEKKQEKRKKFYLAHSLLLFFADLALIAPVSMMVLQQKEIDFTVIPAIAMAAYTTYKIAFSVKNFVKTRKASNLSVKILRNVNFVDALVSVLSLQYTLVMTFNGGIYGEMKILCAVSSLCVWIFLLAMSFVILLQTLKKSKKVTDKNG